MWAVSNRFGHKELPDELNGSKVHRLENVMTMVPGFHTIFDQLKSLVCSNSASELTHGSPDHADMTLNRMKRIDTSSKRHSNKYVTFTMPDPIKHPFSSRGIHAARARIAHLSGAAY
jgi:hypothetical protein